MPDSKYFRFAVWVLLVFLIILVGTQISFIFRPIIVLVNTLFIPVFVAGVLYFLARPVVDFLAAKKLPRTAAILLLYLAFFGVVTVLGIVVVPVISHQFTNLISSIPGFINTIEKELIALQDNPLFQRLQTSEMLEVEDIVSRLTSFLGGVFVAVGDNILSFVGMAANVAVIIILIPFVLFYMLKDGRELSQTMTKRLPATYTDDGKRILQDMDLALSTYIKALLFVALCVGLMVYIGFLIIGIEYSLILALFAMVTNIIPYLGPFIGAVPAVFVAMADSPAMILKVLVVIIIAQQIESSFISPQVMGKKLSIHPLIIIAVLLVGGRFAGFLGMILAVPTYAVLRIVASNSYMLYKIHRKSLEESELKKP